MRWASPRGNLSIRWSSRTPNLVPHGPPIMPARNRDSYRERSRPAHRRRSFPEVAKSKRSRYLRPWLQRRLRGWPRLVRQIRPPNQTSSSFCPTMSVSVISIAAAAHLRRRTSTLWRELARASSTAMHHRCAVPRGVSCSPAVTLSVPGLTVIAAQMPSRQIGK